MSFFVKKVRLITAKYYAKIVREKATPEYIARGWAIGMFYGCLIPFGFQLILSIPTSFMLKGSKIGASLGTLLTNPVSIWFIYPVQCYIGSLFLGGGLNFDTVSQTMGRVLDPSLPWYEAYKVLFSLGWRLAASFFIGGAIFTGIMTPLTYFFVKHLVVQYRERAEKRWSKKQAKGNGRKLS